MVSFTFFGGSEIEMAAEQQVVLTFFGSTDVYCTTVTQELLRLVEETPPSSPWHKKNEAHEKNLYVTVFGAIAMYRPLLGREYLDLKNLLKSGAVDLAEFQVLWMQHTARPFRRAYRAITLFASCEQTSPSSKEELKEIDRLLQAQALEPEEHRDLRNLVSEDHSVALNSLPQVAGRYLPSVSGSSRV